VWTAVTRRRARATGEVIAREIAADAPPGSAERRVTVLDEGGKEITPVSIAPSEVP